MPTFEFSGEIAGAPKEDLFDNLGAKIKVVGVGGAGGNAVDNMIEKLLEGVDFVVANTDAQALITSDVPLKIRIGDQLTGGKGVGGNPDLGMKSAEESLTTGPRLISFSKGFPSL